MMEAYEKALEAAKFIKEYCAKHDDCSEGCIFFASKQEGCYLCNPTIQACDEWDIPTLSKKNEPKEKKIVPFDLSKKEDRDALMGRRICAEGFDIIVTQYTQGTLFGSYDSKWVAHNFEPKWLFEHFTFADGENKGKPVGKEIENE